MMLVTRFLLSMAACAIAACAQVPAPADSAPAAAATAAAVSDLLDRPGERALMAGVAAYDDAQYAQAESQLKRALQVGLVAPRDRAAANKYLAFIYCSTRRETPCEAAFRAALAADPGFALSRGEAGHPMWGPVYRRIKAQ
jgi:hypothetical protein